MTHIFPIYPPLNTTVKRTHFNVYCELFVYVCVSFLSVKRHLLSQTVSVYVCHLIIFKCHVMLGWWRFLREVFLDNKLISPLLLLVRICYMYVCRLPPISSRVFFTMDQGQKRRSNWGPTYCLLLRIEFFIFFF